MFAPAANIAAVAIRIHIPFKTFEDVVGLNTQLLGTCCGSHRAHAAAAQQNGLAASGHSGLELRIEIGVVGHAGPQLPLHGHGARNLPHPGALGVGAHINQHGFTRLHPMPSQRRRNIPA